MFGMQIWKANPHFDWNLKTLQKGHHSGSSLNARADLTDPTGRCGGIGGVFLHFTNVPVPVSRLCTDVNNLFLKLLTAVYGINVDFSCNLWL